MSRRIDDAAGTLDGEASHGSDPAAAGGPVSRSC
jgi:hypothetical protein